jgi:MFS family permease
VVVTAYALDLGSLLLVGGRLGDMYDRKWVFITGLAGFAVSSAIGGAAVSFGAGYRAGIPGRVWGPPGARCPQHSGEAEHPHEAWLMPIYE